MTSESPGQSEAPAREPPPAPPSVPPAQAAGASTSPPAPKYAAPPDAQLTPAMRQYWEQKQQAAGAILLFRMGDFYEMFYDDAELGARVLGIALTSRDRGKTPLAGIPHHALETYLARLVEAGYKVAISEQIEDARQAKGVVKRAIVRIVTPGTLTDDALLDRTQSNVLAALYQQGDEVGLATLELSTGRFVVQVCPTTAAIDELTRLAPAEVLLPEQPHAGRSALDAEIREHVGAAVTYRSVSDFAPHWATRLMEEQFEVGGLEGFGFDSVDASLQAAGALLAYARETQKGAVRHIQPPRRHNAGDHMTLDPATLRSLEIARTIRAGGRAGSLLAAVDETCNPMGARLLRQWLCYPLKRIDLIEQRQRLIEAIRAEDTTRTTLRDALRNIGDVERVVGRIGVQRTHPRDLRSLGNSLARLTTVRDGLRTLHTPDADARADALAGLDALAETLCTALHADAPLTVREGGIFAPGFNAELDRLRAIGTDGQQWLTEFQTRESQRLGIPTLKVGFNKVFGYYIEITNPHKDRAPAEYVRKQTVKNAERYITDELKQYESDALSAESRAHELEYELFISLRDHVAEHIPALQRVATALAELDVLAGWAELSLARQYCRPEFVDEPLLEIEEGRHPVVERTHDNFIPNDASLIAGRQALGIITGPNMAGKSTYIRQVALLTLLAHCGCWVPARRMKLGLVDRIFTRVGASDELARGQSTFMVEMLEAANIVHNATRQSLVILDELGRGTSTFDGLALAWAVAEHLATKCRCRTLFATHYHEMTELEELLDPVFNLNVAVREYEDQLVFLHRIVRGSADRSYGLHVAKLAGVPKQVIDRANAVLNELEQTFTRESQRPALAAVQRRRTRQLRLFEEPEELIVRQIRELDDTQLDAAGAAELVRRWRALLGG